MKNTKKGARNTTGPLLKKITAESLLIDAVDGTETLADDNFFVWSEMSLCCGKTDGSTEYFFKEEENVYATDETHVDVYDITRHTWVMESIGAFFGKYREARNSDRAFFLEKYHNELDKLCLSQAQIKTFIRNYHSWLPLDHCSALFIYKTKQGKFNVASVSINLGGEDHGLRVYRQPLHSSSCSLPKHEDHCHRLIVPLQSAHKKNKAV